jgi:hypothetical protein
MTDWRGLFDALRVEWRDRGANVAKGNINIACPFCARDPSFHLSVSETKAAFYCFRDPRHKGSNVRYLLSALGATSTEAEALLARFSNGSAVPEAKARDASRAERSWQRFESVFASQDALDYLASREIPASTYLPLDLRVARAGAWASRILIPYYHQGTLEAFTGRAWYDHLEPKYRMDPDAPATVYVPSRRVIADRVVVIVEGQFDAIKLTAALPEAQYLVIALGGKNLSAEKVLRIRDAAGGQCATLVGALDADVPVPIANSIISTLASSLRPRYTIRAKLPPHIGDPAKLPLKDIAEWMMCQLSGPAQSLLRRH